MKQKMDYLYWKMRFGMEGMLEDFLTNEDGDSNMVSIVVLIVIIIAVAGIFREKLEEVVTEIFKKLTDFINNTN